MARNNITQSQFITDYIGSRPIGAYDQYASRHQVKIAAQRILRELQLSNFKTIRSLRIPVNEYSKTAILPNDFVDYTKLAVQTKDGYLIDLSPNFNISLAEDLLFDNENAPLLDYNGFPLSSAIERSGDSLENELVPYYILNNLMDDNGFSGRLYGLGGGNNTFGYYRFDYQNNTIVFNPNFDQEEIVLEYISDQSQSIDPIIPTVYEDTFYKGIYSVIIDKMVQVPANEKERARRDYKQAKKLSMARANNRNAQEIVASIYQRFQMAPKFYNRM